MWWDTPAAAPILEIASPSVPPAWRTRGTIESTKPPVSETPNWVTSQDDWSFVAFGGRWRVFDGRCSKLGHPVNN